MGLLRDMLADPAFKRVIVFARTKHGANRIAERLTKEGMAAAAIHGNKSQGARTRALSGFKAGEVRVLVATDIAARGIDIHQLPHVVNLDLPNQAEDYVHRIGRTGRAGKSGTAITIVAPADSKAVAEIENLADFAAAELGDAGEVAFKKGHGKKKAVAAQGSGLDLMKLWNHWPAGSNSSCMVFLFKWVRPKFAA